LKLSAHYSCSEFSRYLANDSIFFWKMAHAHCDANFIKTERYFWLQAGLAFFFARNFSYQSHRGFPDAGA